MDTRNYPRIARSFTDKSKRVSLVSIRWEGWLSESETIRDHVLCTLSF